MFKFNHNNSQLKCDTPQNQSLESNRQSSSDKYLPATPQLGTRQPTEEP